MADRADDGFETPRPSRTDTGREMYKRMRSLGCREDSFDHFTSFASGCGVSVEKARLPDLDQFQPRRFGNLIAVLAHRCEVHFDGFGQAFHNNLYRRTGRNASQKIWHVRANSRSSRSDQNGVGFHDKPACLSLDFFVFGPSSSDMCPAIVTLPGFRGWTYCRWLPLLILQDPPFVVKRFNQVSDLHKSSVPARPLLHPSRSARDSKE